MPVVVFSCFYFISPCATSVWESGLYVHAYKEFDSRFLHGMSWVSLDVFGFFDSVQLKKLVYVYLVRHAEEQQDLALLSISTFQRALKVP